MSFSTESLPQKDGRAYRIGDSLSELELPALDGSLFNLDQVKGKRYMLSFMRFAACPFCQLRTHQLINRWHELDSNFTVIAVFDSPLENLQRYAGKHSAPFSILADEHGDYYQRFAIRHSLVGTLKAMFFRMPKLLYAMLVKGYFPFSIQGKMTTLPADILIDERGVIVSIHHGKDSGDHMPFDQIISFASQT